MQRYLLSFAILLLGGGVAAQQQHMHAKDPFAADSREAFTATAAFASDGSLWLARGTKDQVLVSKSSDLGHTFRAPVPVAAEPLNMDWGPDSRPQIAVDQAGGLVVTYAIFQDKRFNGRVYYARSSDGGASFASPTPITTDATSQRFQTVVVDADGRIFATWLDKRYAAPAIAAGKPYPGAALAFAWADKDGRFGDTYIAFENTCECCRIAVAFAAPGRPAVLFRNVFQGSIRDHAVVTFRSATTPGALRRVSVDDWKIDACPHQGPSLAIATDGSYHAAWFTNGEARQGLFYARADNADGPFSEPRALSSPDRQPARPYLLAAGDALHLVWKEFDGDKSTIRWQVSHDNGRHWSDPRIVAETNDASDHPMLVAYRNHVYLSWLTKREGYRLIPLETAS